MGKRSKISTEKKRGSHELQFKYDFIWGRLQPGSVLSTCEQTQALMVINVERFVSPHPAEVYSSFPLVTEFLFKVNQ